MDNLISLLLEIYIKLFFFPFLNSSFCGFQFFCLLPLLLLATAISISQLFLMYSFVVILMHI